MTNLKRCPACKQWKNKKDFGVSKNTFDKLRWLCRQCNNKAARIYHSNNKKKIRRKKKNYYKKNKNEIGKRTKIYRKNNPQKVKESQRRCHQKRKKKRKKYEKKNKEKLLLQKREWTRKNKDKINKLQRKNRQKNPKKIREREKIASKKKYATPKGKLDNCMGTMIRRSLGENKNGRSWEKLVGYTKDDLKIHLENLFTEGMNWSNHKQFGWHIDHKRAKVLFHYKYPEDPEFQKCWELKNLQPLWWYDNLSKRSKVIHT